MNFRPKTNRAFFLSCLQNASSSIHSALQCGKRGGDEEQKNSDSSAPKRATADLLLLALLRALRRHEAPPLRRPAPLCRRGGGVQAAPRHPGHTPARFNRICPRLLCYILPIFLCCLPLMWSLIRRFWGSQMRRTTEAA
jgi:hypothetical protein